MRRASLLLAAAPLTLALVFFVLRDPPPHVPCDGAPIPAAHLDAYRAGLWWIAGAAELTVLAVMVAGLRAADATTKRVGLSVAALALVPGIAVAGAIAFGVDGPLGAWPLAAGAATTFAVWTLLRWWTCGRPEPAVVALIALASAAVTPVAAYAALIALLTHFLLVFPAAIIGAVGLLRLWAWDREPADLALVATLFALLVVPATVARIVSAGQTVEICGL